MTGLAPSTGGGRGSAGEPDRARRVALVTGGTRGIGLGITRALAREGWDLALGGVRPEESVRGVLEELRGAGADVLYCAGDIASADGRARLVDGVWTRHGRLDALVNNAGRAPRVRADLLEASEDSFEEVLRANLVGPYFLTQRVARLWTEGTAQDAASSAAVVFVTSVSAEMASPSRGEYCVSKAGLSMAARLFAARLAEHGIAVYEVRPGIIATDMTAPVADTYDKRIAEGLVPARRWGTPEDVGRVVAALLRGDVPYATGAVITVDGGLSIPRL
jgi:NAD(P)-dependent dehydrogenase (short-subunit alcohol dehydrogenase family)